MNNVHIGGCVAGPMELHPGPATAALMKLSFDEQHRHAICALGLLSIISLCHTLIVYTHRQGRLFASLSSYEDNAFMLNFS